MAMNLLMEAPALAESVQKVGVKKAHMPIWKIILLGILAGAYVTVGAMGMISFTAGYPLPQVTPGPVNWAGGFVFSGALVFILICGAELFTGNCLMVVALLSRRIFISEMFVDWFLVWTSNMIGGIIFTALLLGTKLHWAHSGGYKFINGTATKVAGEGYSLSGVRTCELANAKAGYGFDEIFFRGIFANFLVCLAVLIAYAAKSPAGKIFGSTLPIMIFVVSGYEHCIANQVLFSFATMMDCPPTKAVNVGADGVRFAHERYWANLFFSTVGNILGGAILAVSYFFAYLYGTSHVLDEVPTQDGVRSLATEEVDALRTKDEHTAASDAQREPVAMQPIGAVVGVPEASTAPSSSVGVNGATER